MLQNIITNFFNYINQYIGLIKSGGITINYLFYFIAIFIFLWLTATFYLTYLIIIKKNKITQITVNQYISIIKD